MNNFMFSFLFFALIVVHLPRVGLALVQCRPLRHCQTRIKGKIKASLRVPLEAVGIALYETQREAKRCSVFLCKVSSYLKLPTFLEATALQHCKLLW